ncbi:hypothetical protein [Micromonospora sp. 15K316]|uniref:hypothetical protein n=1 Tax=Micromonospora sp. 15K316 TaxID=2530376 RepID=UPI001FB6FF53|nr:hypothetical protein [Micromonospora sp. 15K316]
MQLAYARQATAALPVIASRLVNKTPRAEFVMPRRLPLDGEPVCEYLTVRRGLFHGDGFIQTSTIMAPTSLLRRVPFTVGLRRQQELDWTLRALDQDGADLVIAAEPLVLWHQDEDRPRISLNSPWEAQLEWVRKMRPLLTPKAYAAIVMSIISSMAAPTRSFRVFRMLLGDARRHGRPSAIDYLTFFQIWLIPPQLRHTLRDRILSRRRPAPAPDAEPVPATSATRGGGVPPADHPVRTTAAALPVSPVPTTGPGSDVRS